MDQESRSRKRRKYSYLTTDKKSKRYRLQHTETSENIPNIDTSSSSESESEASDHENVEKVDLETPTLPIQRTYLHGPRKYTKDKNTQVKVSTKNQLMQAVVCTKNKLTQHSDPLKAIHSYGVQKTENVSGHIELTHAEKLTQLLSANDNFNHFAQKLHENEQTQKFVKCITALAEGKMPFTNMAWKSFLEMGSLLACTSTTNMEYDKEWLEFCQVIYHMFGGGVINALHGRGHFSQVTSEKSSKGKYKPVEGEFNFPIPSIPTLKKLDIGFLSEIDVGFIEHSLALAQEKASSGGQFILSFDGRLIGPGCKGKSCGDSNMWGMEGPPNLPTAVKILKKQSKQ